MRLSRRTNAIILWLIAIGLLVGMLITFTPTLGGLGGFGGADEGPPALIVNGEPIGELEVARARQNPLFNVVGEGQAAEDLELLLVDELVRQEVIDQAAARVRVSGAEVRQAVEEFREAQGVAGRRNDQAYLQLIGQAGFTDQTFRDYLREQLRRQKFEESLLEDVEVSDAEVEAYYQAFADEYRTEERIRARAIVVDDVELAQELAERAQAGEDFAQLASEYSLERADRGGALGAAAGQDEPQPVGRAALPTAVADAAFALRGPGLTEVVEVGERAYLVQVEEYLPPEERPLEEVREQVREDALEAKRAGVLQQRVEQLVAEATVEIPEGSDLEYSNPVVARVGDEEIHAAELVRATYTNPQIQQALGPQTAGIVVDFFKPTVLEQLIERELAAQGAEDLGAEFVGGDAQVAQQALSVISRDAAVDETEVEEYYQANQARFTMPPEAEVTQVAFDDPETAEAFRQALLAGAELEAAAEAEGGVVEEVGAVSPGTLAQPLDAALFATDGFEPLPEGEREVSDVVVLSESTPEEAPAAEVEGAEEPAAEAVGEEDADPEAAAEPAGERFVVLVARRTPTRVLPLEEVREQVERAVLEGQRAALRQDWLDSLRQEIEVENLLAAAEPAGEAPVALPEAAAEPAAADEAEVEPEALEVDEVEPEALDVDEVEPGGAEVPAGAGAEPAPAGVEAEPAPGPGQ